MEKRSYTTGFASVDSESTAPKARRKLHRVGGRRLRVVDLQSGVKQPARMVASRMHRRILNVDSGTARTGMAKTAMMIACLTQTVLWAGCAPIRRPVPEDCRQRVQKRADAFCAEHDCPGVTVGFVLADGRSGTVASGVSHKASGQAMRPSDRMLMGSVGKTYVSAVMLQLVEEGRAKLDTKISHWFGEDEWFARLPNANAITLRTLMNHTSGIPRYIFTLEFQETFKADLQRSWQPEELVAFVLGSEPLFSVGEDWSYADTNYILVGMILERVCGRTFYEELTDRVLKPLKLSDTTPSDRPELKGLVCGYTTEENVFGMPVEVVTDGRYAINPQFEWTGGGLITTSLDLALWAKHLYGGDALEAESREQMCTGVSTTWSPGREYGLGTIIRPSVHGPVYGHGGYMPGYLSTMAYYSNHGVAVAVQVNTEVNTKFAAIEELADAVAGELLHD